MENAVEQYLPRIRALCPTLSIETIAFNGEGLVNDVVIINGTTAFRFAKREAGKAVLAKEICILDLIRPHLAVAVPQPFYTDCDLMAYPLLPGASLTRPTWAALDQSAQQRVIDQLATFLRTLHQFPHAATLPATDAPHRYEDWVGIRQRVATKMYPLLLKHQVAWVEHLFATFMDDPSNFAYPPALIHGDLACYHLLVDAGTGCLSGVIDFGVAGLGDPANDLACLLQYYGAAFVQRLYGGYPEAQQLMGRAQFYAQAIELEWVLAGLESGEPFWFTAHIGNARA